MKPADWQSMEEHQQIMSAIRQETKEWLKTHDEPTYEMLQKYYSEAIYCLKDHPQEPKVATDFCHYATKWADYKWENNQDPWYKMYLACLLFEAPYVFDSYMLYLEHKRNPEDQFYLPRREILKPVVQDLQDLEDGKFQYYCLSMPPRVGKSTICIFFLTWVCGKRPNSNNAMGGHSGMLAKGFYEEMVNIFESSEYCFAEIFPKCVKRNKVVQKKSADEYTINLGIFKRFPTMTCRGIDGSWTGAINITGGKKNFGYLYIDDLIRDRTHSLNPRRMEETYQEMNNKMLDRMNDGSKVIMVGTLWSVLDPIARWIEKYKDDPRYRFRKIPALNENDESNFNYPVNGFSTQHYRDMRDRLDPPEFAAKFMQAPYIREGILFGNDKLSYFNGLIAKDEVGEIKAVCDPAFGGGDSASMPIGLKIDNKVYIIDWVFDNGTPEQTIPKIGNAIMKYGIKSITFEKNNGGELYAQKVKDYLKVYDYDCAMECKPAPNRISKIDKIKGYADRIINNFVFLDGKETDYKLDDLSEFELYKCSQEYKHAMDELNMFVTVGKNEHDDAADSLTMLAIEIFGYLDGMSNSVTVIKNPFWG